MSLPQTFLKDASYIQAPDEVVTNVIIIETNLYTEPTVFAPGPIQPDESSELFYEKISFGGLRERLERMDDDYSENI